MSMLFTRKSRFHHFLSAVASMAIITVLARVPRGVCRDRSLIHFRVDKTDLRLKRQWSYQCQWFWEGTHFRQFVVACDISYELGFMAPCQNCDTCERECVIHVKLVHGRQQIHTCQ